MRGRFDKMKKWEESFCKKINQFRNWTTPSAVFITATAVCLLLFLWNIVDSHGAVIEKFFFHDVRDTGMDFLHSIEYVRGRHPYEQFQTLYPPLANFMFMCLFRMVPEWICHLWPDDFAESVGLRGTDLDLRTYQATMLLFILFLIVCTALITQLVQYAMRERAGWERNLIVWSVLLSYGVLNAFERGNIIILAWILTIFFLLFYDSDKFVLRELAALALAVAAGIKLYPALFGVLLLKRKSMFLALRTVSYGLMSVILPCFLFKEGLSAIGMWIEVTLKFGASEPSPIGNSFQNILFSVQDLMREYLGVEMSAGWFGIASIVVVAFCILVSFSFKEDWRKVLAITLGMVLFSKQADYIYVFFSIPLLVMLRGENRLRWNNVLEMAGMIALTVPLPLFYEKDIYYPRNTLAQIVMVILLVLLGIQFLIRLREMIRSKNETVG